MELPFCRIERALGRLFAPRMGLWLYVSIALLAALWWLAPHMLPVTLYKMVLLTIAAFVGDKIARAMERSGPRPHEYLRQAESYAANGQIEEARHFEGLAGFAYLRRAIVISAAMIAAALGT